MLPIQSGKDGNSTIVEQKQRKICSHIGCAMRAHTNHCL